MSGSGKQTAKDRERADGGAGKRLYVLRHAKSSWAAPGLTDHERPLNARGERAAALVGAWLAQRGIAPDLVLCSTARRALQTLEGIRPWLPDAIAVSIEDDLYLAAPERWIERLRAVDDAVDTVLLVGHNPGLEELVQALADGGDADALRRLDQGSPRRRSRTSACVRRTGPAWGPVARGSRA